MSSNNDPKPSHPQNVQTLGEQLRAKNLGYYDFKNKLCRIHNIPLIQYQTEQENARPWHCPQCILIPDNWKPVNQTKDNNA